MAGMTCDWYVHPACTGDARFAVVFGCEHGHIAHRMLCYVHYRAWRHAWTQTCPYGHQCFESLHKDLVTGSEAEYP